MHVRRAYVCLSELLTTRHPLRELLGQAAEDGLGEARLLSQLRLHVHQPLFSHSTSLSQFSDDLLLKTERSGKSTVVFKLQFSEEI